MPPEKTKKSVPSNSQFRSDNREIDNINNTYKKDNESKSLAFNDISKAPIIIKRPPKKPKKPLWDFDDLMWCILISQSLYSRNTILIYIDLGDFP